VYDFQRRTAGCHTSRFFCDKWDRNAKAALVSCRLKMQTAPESPEPFARTDKSAPCQGNTTIIDKIQQEIKLL
jgi:hypothetical protein